MDETDLLTGALAADPGDWLGRLALADRLLDRGDEAVSRLARAEGWKWAWAEEASRVGYRLAHLYGRGNGIKDAAFAVEGRGDVQWLVWRADLYDLPGDHDSPHDAADAAWSRCPWLTASPHWRGSHALPDVWAGAPLIEWCRALALANGWWQPVPCRMVEV